MFEIACQIFELLAYIAAAASFSPSPPLPSPSLLLLLILHPNLSKDNHSDYVMFLDGVRNVN